MSNITTIDSAPRTLEGLSEYKAHKRYSLALALGVFKNGSQEEVAFLSEPPQVQSQALLNALINYDKNSTPQAGYTGPMVPQQMPVQPPQAPLVPAQYAPPVQSVHQAPGQYAPPLPPAGAPAWQTQQPQQPAYQPPRAPMAPVPMPPQYQPQAAFPPQQPQAVQGNGRSPVTAGDPGNVGGRPDVAPPPMPPLNLAVLEKALREVKKGLELAASKSDIEELRQLVLGVARMQNIFGLMLLDLASNSMEIDKQVLVNMLSARSKSNELENMLNGSEGTEGKG